MTLNDFVNNLSGMCDGQDFSRELLKVIVSLFVGLKFFSNKHSKS